MCEINSRSKHSFYLVKLKFIISDSKFTISFFCVRKLEWIIIIWIESNFLLCLIYFLCHTLSNVCKIPFWFFLFDWIHLNSRSIEILNSPYLLLVRNTYTNYLYLILMRVRAFMARILLFRHMSWAFAHSFEFYRILIIECAEYWWMGIVIFVCHFFSFSSRLPEQLILLFLSISSSSCSAYLSVLTPWNYLPHTFALKCLCPQK